MSSMAVGNEASVAPSVPVCVSSQMLLVTAVIIARTINNKKYFFVFSVCVHSRIDVV